MNKKRFNFLLASATPFLLISPSFYLLGAMQVTTVCKSYTITSSDGGYWTGESCWEEYSGSSGGEPTEPTGPDGGGGGNSSQTYLGTPTDTDANGTLDCWKDVTESGDYVLDSGDDYGPRVLNGESDFHHGIDIAANLGTPIYSPARGTVTDIAQSTAENSFNGAHVRMRFYRGGDYFEAVMIHMKEDTVIVEKGDSLVPGQPIGQVNSTGNSFGNHLHFQVYELTPVPGEPLLPGEKPGPQQYAKNSIDPLTLMGDESCQKQN